ncbi:MAG: nuclear transport factor 2 family protein [Leptolyngbyaceae cyanobacterium SU_3_3]|nr:nuclear transport factor 2 family protein [Leptolyngbyaceae cyanobacterium SU_3_3]
MNEQANRQLVQQAYQSVQAGDVQSLLNSLTEDVQWQLPEMENVPFAGTWHGREQVGQFFSTVAQTQDVVEFEPEEFIAQDDKVVVLGRFSQRVKSTGRIAASAWAHVWTVKDGKITHFHEYVDTAAVSRAHTAAQEKTMNTPEQEKTRAAWDKIAAGEAEP